MTRYVTIVHLYYKTWWEDGNEIYLEIVPILNGEVNLWIDFVKLHREKSSRQRMEETLNELRQEEALQRSSHTELLHEFQQLSCDNQLW